jgi:hypothetical protein
MKLRLLTLLAALLLCAPSHAQTIKSLGYNTTNGFVVYSGTNPLTFTNSLQFATNARAATRTNLGGTTVGNSVFTATNAQAAATAIGLGATNYPTFRGIEILTDGYELYITSFSISSQSFGGELIFDQQRLTQDGADIFAWDTNSFAVTPPATFATNVSIAGSLSVGSLTTTTPSTWALDATQTAADTNGVLTLPSNANVLRITNANTISGVSNGILGAFYFLINQSGTNVVISNSATITARGATNITLGANESATLISTTATNATAH